MSGVFVSIFTTLYSVSKSHTHLMAMAQIQDDQNVGHFLPH